MYMPAGQPALWTWLANCAKVAATARNGKTPEIGTNWTFTLPGEIDRQPRPAPEPPVSQLLGELGQSLQSPGVWGLSSYHPGGANVLMCDGSARFLKNSTANNVIWALGSRAQGEVISADSY